jgi:MoCo/4Fe-4S cofactor protein with predicted Tat translocation signal
MNEKFNLTGKDYWRSLDQLSDTPEFREFLEREFPEGASELTNRISRRNFLTLMGASMALAGLAGCRRPVEKIIPYVVQPEVIIPGVANHYATTMPLGNSAYGLIVESHEGRPTKIEGNRDHPSTLGASNPMIQAAILGLYDPDRSDSVLHKGENTEWAKFVEFWQSRFGQYSSDKGIGLAVLSESFSSPTLSRLAARFKANFPEARWVTYESVSDENMCEGHRVATGERYRPAYHFDKAKVVLALDSDFLYGESESIINARGFIDGRRMESENDEMNRLYAVESSMTVTGAMADHRMPLKSQLVGSLTAALIRELSRQGLKTDTIFPDIQFFTAPDLDLKWIEAVARDLMRNRGKALVIAGRHQPPGVHAMVFAINQWLGNIGTSVDYRPMEDSAFSSNSDLGKLIDGMYSGSIKTLFILGGNPVYNSFANQDFEAALEKTEESIHLSQYVDETSKLTSWHIPMAHFLENWGDAIAADGTRSVIQPLIAPLFGGHSMVELVNLITNGQDETGYELVKAVWKDILPEGDFEKEWERILHDGLLKQNRSEFAKPVLKGASIQTHLRKNISSYHAVTGEDIELTFRASLAVYDGRFANVGWLQELPDPITKLTWDNAALVSPATARRLNLESEDIVTLEYDGRSLDVPIWVSPGQADDSISLSLGYGRENSGRVGSGVGVSAYLLRTSNAPDFGGGVKLTKTGGKYRLANTQDHGSMEGRPLLREATLDEYREHPDFAPEMVEIPPLHNLWKEHKYDQGYQWGMTIDLNACIGCNACTIACQSENNIPVVGKDQVARGREMHWIRLDRYFTGKTDDPEVVHQPVACQHCENAPCEEVCPVAATMHDKEGLNMQVYNRCIGTRYCSNNCPYKVRRFNFFNFTSDTPEVVKMAQNPDVTIRSRGVMEKCTYCLQRINEARIKAKVENREIRDGDIITACQQSCPTQAIVFGNINDPESAVSKMKRLNRGYKLLAEFNTRPRTSFLAKIRNPNPDLAES